MNHNTTHTDAFAGWSHAAKAARVQTVAGRLSRTMTIEAPTKDIGPRRINAGDEKDVLRSINPADVRLIRRSPAREMLQELSQAAAIKTDQNASSLVRDWQEATEAMENLFPGVRLRVTIEME